MSRLKVYDLATGQWMYAGAVDSAQLALDSAFTSRYGRRTRGTSATPPTAVIVGEEYVDTIRNRLWVWNGTAWRFVRSLDGVNRAGLVLTSASQAVANVTTVQTIWTTEVSDVDGWITAPSGSLTVPAGWDGSYDVTYRVNFSVSSTGNVDITLVYSGAVILSAGGPIPNAHRSVSGQLRGISAGAVIGCSAFNNTGASINMSCTLVLDWKGP